MPSGLWSQGTVRAYTVGTQTSRGRKKTANWRKSTRQEKIRTMQGDPKLIQSLNGILTYELTSINQYFLHARMFRHLGLEALNGKSYSKSIEDMKQADRLIERILFLQGLPNLQKLGKLSIGEHPEEMLRADLGFAVAQLPLLRDGISLCEVQRDFVSRDLLEGILHYEEEHIEWIETQLSLIGSIGVQRYLQSQISSD